MTVKRKKISGEIKLGSAILTDFDKFSLVLFGRYLRNKLYLMKILFDLVFLVASLRMCARNIRSFCTFSKIALILVLNLRSALY